MVRVPRLLWCVLLLMLACTSYRASAQGAQVWNGWSFATPLGWRMEHTAEAMVLLPPGDAADRVLLLPPQPAQAGLAAWFPSAVQQQTSALRGFRPGPVKSSKTAEGVATLVMTGQALGPVGQRLILSFLGMVNANGDGLLMVAQFDQLGVLRNLRPYGAFVKTLEPGPASSVVARATPGIAAQDRGEPPLHTAPRSATRAGSEPASQPNVDLAEAAGPPPAAPNGHDLYDWFGSFYNAIMPGPNFTISSNMVWNFYRFFPNGYVYEGLPAGMDPAALNCPGPVKGGKCKQYSITGSTLTIAGEKPHTFAREGTGIKVDGSTMNRVRRADAPLNGRWKTSSGGGVGTTVTLSQHTLTLRPDGTFAIEGSTGVSAANAAAYNSSAESGRYKVNGYTIEFDYANGRVVRQSFLLPYSDDKVFLVGNSMYFVPTK